MSWSGTWGRRRRERESNTSQSASLRVCWAVCCCLYGLCIRCKTSAVKTSSNLFLVFISGSFSFFLRCHFPRFLTRLWFFVREFNESRGRKKGEEMRWSERQDVVSKDHLWCNLSFDGKQQNFYSPSDREVDYEKLMHLQVWWLQLAHKFYDQNLKEKFTGSCIKFQIAFWTHLAMLHRSDPIFKWIRFS